MKPPCRICDSRHSSDWAVVSGSRFNTVVTLYRARTAPDAAPRATRAEAVADECAWRAAGGAA